MPRPFRSFFAGGRGNGGWPFAAVCFVLASRPAQVRLINPLFLPIPDPLPEGKDWVEYMNPEAWVQCTAKVERALGQCVLEDRFQFERCGYFVAWKDLSPSLQLVAALSPCALALSESLRRLTTIALTHLPSLPSTGWCL